MKQYLLDTNICIYFLKGRYGIDEKIREAGLENCFISEITLAELKFGAENSEQVERNRATIAEFQKGLGIIPISNVLDLFAREKARLRKAGKTIDEFDLLIGATAVEYKLILVTNNVKHFERIEGIEIENWVIS